MKWIPVGPVKLFSAGILILALSTPAAFTLEPFPLDSGITPMSLRAGESLEYTISWSTFISAATMTATVNKRGIYDGIDSYHVVLRGKTIGIAGYLYEVSSTYESYIDAASLLPFRATDSFKQPKREEKHVYRLDPAKNTAFLEDGTTLTIPSTTYDIASLFFALRRIDTTLHKPVKLSVIENNEVYTLVAEAEGYKKLSTKAGDFDTILIAIKVEIDGQLNDSGKMRLYLSRDAHRRPVLITIALPIGSIRAELISIR